MTPVDLASVVAGSVTLVAMLASIAFRSTCCRIPAVNQSWQKVHVEA